MLGGGAGGECNRIKVPVEIGKELTCHKKNINKIKSSSTKKIN